MANFSRIFLLIIQKNFYLRPRGSNWFKRICERKKYSKYHIFRNYNVRNISNFFAPIQLWVSLWSFINILCRLNFPENFRFQIQMCSPKMLFWESKLCCRIGSLGAKVAQCLLNRGARAQVKEYLKKGSPSRTVTFWSHCDIFSVW